MNRCDKCDEELRNIQNGWWRCPSCADLLSNNQVDEFENVPGTWSYELKQHWNAFTGGCWRVFNFACEEMRERGHENKVDKFAWREYVLWDLQRRHNEEKKISKC